MGYFPYSTTSASFLSALHTTGHDVKHDWKTAAGLSKSQDDKAHSGLCHLVHWLVLVPLGIASVTLQTHSGEAQSAPVAKALHGSLARVVWGLCRALGVHSCPLPRDFPSLTVGGAEAILVGVICRCHLDGGRGGEHQDVCAGGVLGGVELGRLQVQSRAAPEHRAHGHRVWGDTNGTGGHCMAPQTPALCPGTPLPTPPALQTHRHSARA